MASRKIKLKDQLGRVVRIPSGASVTPSQPAPAPAQPDRPPPSATVWKLIREVPANLQKLAKLAGAGFATRGPDGEWHQRSLAQGQGIEVTNADGVAGDPVVSLAPVVRPAAATVSALRVVSESAAGIRHLDPVDGDSVAGMLGLSITAGSTGAAIKIKTSGTIDDAGWSWSPGFVFAGSNGELTQALPTTGWEIVVGYAPSATRLNLTFDEPVKLA